MLSPLTLAHQAQNAAAPTLISRTPEAIDESILAVIGMGVVGVIAVLVITIVIPVRAHMKNEREREQTKREIAAYVAEGSIPPSEGAKMIKAAEKPVFDMWGKRC